MDDILQSFKKKFNDIDIRGAVLSLKQDFVLKKGLNAIISGEIAYSIGGLSSSAAVTTAYLMA